MRKKNQSTKKVFLHWTLSTLALEEIFPRLFCATHRYSPLSVLLKFIIFSCLSPFLRKILEFPLVFSGDPFMVHDTVGVGCPSTIQDIFTAVPSAGLISVE